MWTPGHLGTVGFLHRSGTSVVALMLVSLFSLGVATEAKGQACERTISADVVALDQHFFWNRMGVLQPQGMIFALLEDVRPIIDGTELAPGNVKLREDKRPRPIVLRMNVGDCLQINFTNYLAAVRVDEEQPATRTASIHITGLQLVNSITDDGTFVGRNPSSLVSPGGSAVYTLYAEREGNHHLYSAAATTGGEGDGGSLSAGLHGSLNIEPRGAEWYRSQVTRDDIELAKTGTTPGGQPILNYDALYPVGHRLEGKPILRMLDAAGKIRHTDLFAIITGPGRGSHVPGTYPPNPVYPNRDQSFREFTFIYEGEIGAVQAFPIFDDPVFSHTLHSVVDGFGINYGTGGIGAEIVGNRFAVGPMWDCTECKYEEFFLTSWVLGDPAMVVDIPANANLGADGLPLAPGPKATKALYPDDPSNVAHSYIGDHTKFRILHGGPKEFHIHHLHAHQWLYTPDSDESAYLDSQAIGPGSAYTLEIAYNGSGNRNQVVGDSIFHCHFYPHFAQGMWHLWRTHDVFEQGTQLDADGRPMPGARALPDPEIITGSPIAAVVPIPELVMAPMPEADVDIVVVPGLPGGQIQVTGAGNPGYPFFVAGVVGHRPPHPPMDTPTDGGLSRHVISGGTAVSVQTRLDFTKEITSAVAVDIPEGGTPLELEAMAYHAQRLHPSYKQDGTAGNFVLNGLPPTPGAPYAEPCIDDMGMPVGDPRTYKVAGLEIDAVLSKTGWHFPQTRMISMWEDVASYIDGSRAPEPFFFRANSESCITYHHVNLIPNIYELDDFQVRTPTDVLGQHIHLVKFDVTSSDGSGNGWNYEDGTFSPDEVRERIHAIRVNNACTDPDLRDGTFECPVAEAHPFFGAGPNGKWMGAQTTIQRWYADDVLNIGREDRTLRTVFTHDHYGPSTVQQAGLYCGLLVEPKGSVWRDPETGEIMGGRADGGPTSWKADILTVDPADSHREFMFEFADFQLAYKANNKTPAPYDVNTILAGGRQPGDGFDDPANAVNPPAAVEAFPDLRIPPVICPGGVPLPCPEAISAEDPGAMSVNYRSEPIAMRIRDPLTNSQAGGEAGDLALAFRSDIVRADPALNVQPTVYPPLTGGVQPGDPYTPLMRVYDGDKVQIRSMVGATEEGHNFSINGIKWLQEPSWSNSGWRNSQMMGISEHFEFNSPIVIPKSARGATSDFLYKPGSSTDDLWTGMWGILRAYKGNQADLLPLPNNPPGGPAMTNSSDFKGVCPVDAPVRLLDVTAVLAKDILADGALIYNSRTDSGGPLNDPTAILYVRSYDLGADGKLKPGIPVEPLILRVTAGDCIVLTLRNKLPAATPMPDLDGRSTLPMVVNFFNANDISPSSLVGLHPQLLAYDVTRSDGMEVGFNNRQTAAPGGKQTYTWYAGDLTLQPDGMLVATPIEFGTIGLSPADVIKQPSKGLVGAMIVEPAGATWVEDTNSRAQATVTVGTTSFREFVLVFQSDVNLRLGDGSVVQNTAGEEDAEDSGQKAFNYRTEPTWFRMGYAADTDLGVTGAMDFTSAWSNAQVGGDPETPIFLAAAGMPVRFRITQPGGNQRNHVFQIHGHTWQFLPYVENSTKIGNNPLSQWTGNTSGIGPSSHFDILPENGAGGKFGVVGDYMYRDMASFAFDGGLWGIFRVGGVCASDADCDDSQFCNGTETCDANGGCQAGDDPCPGLMCNEDLLPVPGCIDLGGGLDECPTDPLKIAPGVCGCGVVDEETEIPADNVLDCLDVCDGFDDNLDADLDTVPDGCDICPGMPDRVTLQIEATTHIVGSGKKPKTNKDPLDGVDVCIYDKSATSCALTVCGGTSHAQYECIATFCEPVDCCQTAANGTCSMQPLPADYVAVAFDPTFALLPDPIGANVSASGCGDIKRVRLKQIIRADGKKMSAKTIVLTGSDLEIIEPEFVLWDTEDQQYPFVFAAVGDWGVETTVLPPEGFVTDYDALGTIVLTETTESVQFQITEIGSDLVPTPTTFVVNHNGVQRIVHSQVDIRLTPEYAKSRGFDVVELQRRGLIHEPLRGKQSRQSRRSTTPAQPK